MKSSSSKGSSSNLGCVLGDDIPLVVLELSERNKDDISRIHPYAFSHFSSYVAEAADTVEAVRLETPVAQHAQHLAIF